MKNLTLLVAFTILSSITFGQITITQNDVVDVGDYVVMKEDTMPSSITPGSAGINQTWNFSSLNQHNIDTLGFDDPSTTSYYSSFPNANICGKDTTGGGFYLRKTSQFLTVEGFAGTVDVQGVPILIVAPFQPADTMIKFPLNYLDWGNNQYQEIDQTQYYGQTVGAFVIDSVRMKSNKMKSYVIDAWGNLTTPVSTYPVLRQNLQEISIDSIWVYPQLTHSWTLYQWKRDTVKKYNWFAQNIGLQLVEMEWDEDSLAAVSVSWISETTHNSIIENRQMKLKIYPNPTSSILFVNFEEKSSGIINIYDIKGSLVLEEKIQNLNMKVFNVENFEKGIYVIEYISDKRNIYINKFIKE